MPPLELRILPDTLAVCRREAHDDVPDWALRGSFLTITRTGRELSLVCRESDLPPGIQAERGFRALEAAGPLDFGLTGVLASLLVPLATARVSVFAISTHDTDYVLVRHRDLDRAADALRAAGHRVEGG